MYCNTLEYNIIVINNKDVGIFAVDESYKGESYISEISLNNVELNISLWNYTRRKIYFK